MDPRKKLVERYLAENYPAAASRTEVEIDTTCREAKNGYTFTAKGRGGQVQLTLHRVSRETIERATRAANSVFHGVVVGDAMTSEQIRGRES